MNLQKPRICFLDEACVGRGDLDLTPIRRWGSYRSYPNTRGHREIVRRARGAEIIVTNKVVFSEREFTDLPKLRLVTVTATGVNNIDLQAARRHGIAVANARDYSTVTVAEHALMFLLAFGHRLFEHHRSAVDGSWSRSPIYAILDYPFSDLSGQTLGIIGYGNIGKRVAQFGQRLGMKILVARLPGRKYRPGERRVSLQTLLRQSDFISIHTALTPKTYHLLNRKNLHTLKQSTFVMNLARGAIVNEREMALALKKGRLAGYATDVLSEEPPPKNHPLLRKGLKNKVMVTPHVAWGSRESRQRVIDEMGKNIGAYLKGKRRMRLV